VTEFATLLDALADGRVAYVIVGGLAATIHGSSRLTSDVDVVYSRAEENLDRLVAALRPYEPYLRGAPRGLPFEWSPATLRRGLNFSLITTRGEIDLLGEIVGGGSYDDVLPHSQVVTMFGREHRCIALDWLIRTKRAAGRAKDLEAIAELELLHDDPDLHPP
jgi:hypothetical protein